MLRRVAAALALLVAAQPFFAAQRGGPVQVPLPVFPANNWWNIDISAAPVDTNSTNLMTASLLTAPSSVGLHPDFGGDSGDPDFPVYGFPYIVVDGTQPKKTIAFDDFIDQSDGVDHSTETPVPFYPVPDEAITMTGWVEGGAPGNVNQRDDADRHILIVDKTNNHLYELYNCWHNGTAWTAASGAFFDMNANDRREEGWTSADASGMAIFPGLVRTDEVFGPDEIRHALRVTVRRTNGYVWPASHVAGSTPGALPMGARLRLKADKDISSYPASVQKIFRAFKKYGLMVADNGSNMYVSGTYDTNWNNDILNPAFSALKASDFEVIQLGWHPPITFILTLPASTGSGDAVGATLTAYGPNYAVATGYTGTVHFTSTDGAATLPVNYTFTPGDAGAHTFAAGFTLRTAGTQSVTVTDTGNAAVTLTRGIGVGPATPAGFAATAASSTSVNLAWTASAGATQYEIVRASASSSFATLTTIAGTSFTDATASPNTAYVYSVKANNGAYSSSYSAPDLATTTLFTNDPLATGVTPVKAVHLTELRQAANSLRAAAGLGAATFTDPTLNSTVAVKAVHIQELRNAISGARSALGLATAFADPTLTPGSTPIKAVHVQQLRDALK